MKRCKSTTSAMNSQDAENTEDDVKYVERRLQEMADELEHYRDSLDFRTFVFVVVLTIIYILQLL